MDLIIPKFDPAIGKVRSFQLTIQKDAYRPRNIRMRGLEHVVEPIRRSTQHFDALQVGHRSQLDRAVPDRVVVAKLDHASDATSIKSEGTHV